MLSIPSTTFYEAEDVTVQFSWLVDRSALHNAVKKASTFLPSHCVLLGRNSTYQIFSPYHLPNINDGPWHPRRLFSSNIVCWSVPNVPSAIIYILDQNLTSM